VTPAALLLLAALAAPPIAQGPVAILESAPEEGSPLQADLDALLEGAAPLIIQLSAQGSSQLDLEGKVILASGDKESADSRELSERIRGADAVTLEGGALLPWYETLFEARRPTRLVHALARLNREGRPIIGVGPAGAILAGGGVVELAQLEEVERNPRKRAELGARVVLGWGPPALIDADAWGGLAMRTLRIMERSYMSKAAHLGPGAGLVLLPRHKKVRVIGHGGVTLFETSPGRRNRTQLRRGSLSLLTRGDEWELARGRLIPSPGGAPSLEGRYAFRESLARFAADPASKVIVEGPWGKLWVSQREDTRLVGPLEAQRPIRAQFDLFDSP